MKQGTAKTLGVAALGLAFAAVGAGTASAAPAGLLPGGAGDAVKDLPLAGSAMERGQGALNKTTGGVSRAANNAQKTPTVQKFGKSAGKLLGGVPAGKLAKGGGVGNLGGVGKAGGLGGIG
ncbi:ATP-binding protein [Streptomyces meridianus]|uniref:ATP-binding protein n=1 Tax=Streptomyces meridianus TaxID=2938945 RepID=A0ABT0X7H0_9ACTN|nr:ATP-binding protein [Streptomyces meridianus]MCM2577893.1 ATP-binding protein [Streptomyces meridianus]